MSPETLNIIVGALIALLSSILTSFINNRFQKTNTIKQREFLLQDAYIQNRSQIIISRADEVEKLINEYIVWYSKLNSSLMSLQMSDEELRASVQKLQEEFWKLPYMPHVMIIAKSLDSALGATIENLLNKLLKINLMLFPYSVKASEQHPVDIVGPKLESIDLFFPLVIAGLDKIRIDSKKPAQADGKASTPLSKKTSASKRLPNTGST